MDSDFRHERIARNEASFREINERLNAGLRQVSDPRPVEQYVCECGDRACAALIPLSFVHYDAVRAHATRFAVAPGHVFPEVERVVEEHEDFMVLEKIGESRRLGEATDPRHRPT